ncbi:MAG TPA: hypothetical protein VGH28_30415 [Polyangiaceae bacterium]|jgi:hypothetical protein
MPSDADRELAADVAYLLREVETFGGVYADTREDRVRLMAVVDDDRARLRAAARLTVNPSAAAVDLVTTRSIRGERLALSEEEIGAAARRDTQRREAWNALPPIESHVNDSARARSVFFVTRQPEEHARILRTRASIPLTTFGTNDAARALDVLAIHTLPDLIVLDRDLDGIAELERTIRGFYPARFGDGKRIAFMGSSRAFGQKTIARILSAVGAQTRSEREAELPFSRVRIAVVEESPGDLPAEIAHAAPGAEVVDVPVQDMFDISRDAADLFVIELEGTHDLASIVTVIVRRFGRVVPVLFVSPFELDAGPGTEVIVVKRPITAEALRRALEFPGRI